jgi:hypothetical protein
MDNPVTNRASSGIIFRKLRIVWSIWWGVLFWGVATIIIWPAILAAPFAFLPRQFSLRTLLIAMTLVAIGLGWAVYVLRN